MEVSEPTVAYRSAEDHQIKVTPGITGLSRPSVHSDGAVWHLDVGSSHPGGGEASKGLAVRQLKWYASWVQTVEKLKVYKVKKFVKSTFVQFEPKVQDIIHGGF